MYVLLLIKYSEKFPKTFIFAVNLIGKYQHESFFGLLKHIKLAYLATI